QKVKEALPGVRLTLIQPSPFDDVTRAPSFEGGYNAVLVRYGDFVKQLAARQGATVADLNTPVVVALEKANSLDADTAKKIVPDRVHPAPGGHLLMAEALLKAWSAPSVVTAVAIDAVGPRASRQENTVVERLKTDNGGLSWEQKDDALPMPLDMKDPVVSLAVRASDVVQAVDQQPLQVSGLTQPQYTLKIDGDEVGSFSREELPGGVYRAVLPRPMLKQAQAVHELTLRHNNVHYIRWRQVQVPLQASTSSHLRKALRELDAMEEEFVKQQRAAAQPKSHRYELTP